MRRSLLWYTRDLMSRAARYRVSTSRLRVRSPLAHVLEYRHRPPSISGIFHLRALGPTQVYGPTALNFAS